jgi:oxygen-independent coproporphyrinogen-3 oxidase
MVSTDYHVPRALLDKYAKPGPRYTSYPTAPEWGDMDTAAAQQLYAANNPATAINPIALYVHLPYCEALCYYCGCNMKVSRNKAVMEPYLTALYREIEQVTATWAPQRQVTQMHWGGGTPSYLSAPQITALVAKIRQHVTFAEDAELSIEVHPSVTTPEHVAALQASGFNRLSMGVQDFNPEVQAAVNRHQTFEQTRDLVALARTSGFGSINVDLMYGLPHQTLASFEATLEQVYALNPDRLALFHYAHVPWLKPAQKLLPQEAMPSSEEKLAIFEMAVASFLERGYVYIGMDHFARPDDELALAQKHHTLRRNFMGYTTQAGVDLYGLGVSSISEIDGHFLQNEREIPAYEARLADGQLATAKGLLLSPEDHLRKAVIESLICNGYLDFEALGQRFAIDFVAHFAAELAASQALEADGLITMQPDHLRVLPRGQILIRNVCMIWDAYLGQRAGQQMFSRAL